jgi:hypothetical protein
MTNGSYQHIAARKIFHFVFAVPERTRFSGIGGDRQELGEREVTVSDEPTVMRAGDIGEINVAP